MASESEDSPLVTRHWSLILMHPTLIRIGSFQLPTFGVLLAAAIVLALYTIVRLGRREGLDTGRLVDFSTWLLVVGLVGAKVLMILT
ncbi:MAG: hypothetical protein DMG25_00365, partial [Acidobacteria bacterium]